MADSHEEQLLNDLLRGIAHDDAHLAAPQLESRVLAAVESAEVVRRGPVTAYRVIAAAALAAVLVPAVYRTQPTPSGEPVGRNADAAEVTIPDKSEKPPIVVREPASPPAARVTRALPVRQTQPNPFESSIAQSSIDQSLMAPSPDEFLPLIPITAQELTGSFQIVRVQMPRASLGALRSPLEQPNELVEADVLLGEDGMARAIRLSTSGSVYPWRSR
jgi:hypothetical protein